MVRFYAHHHHHHKSSVSFTINNFLFRIVHAWTAPTIHTSRKIALFTNRNYATKHPFNLYNAQILLQKYQASSALSSTSIRYELTTSTRHRIPVRLFASNEIDIHDDNNNHDDDNVTDDRDLYEYDDTESNQWLVPSKIYIPEERIGMKFVRSSGAGGQNVNKVSSCVQIRFHVLSADWMGPLEVRQRFFQQYRNTIGKHDGVYHMESQAHRTQSDNRKDALRKLEAAVLQVWPRPKVRKLRVGMTEQGKRKRRDEKEKQSSKKEGRRNQRFDF